MADPVVGQKDSPHIWVANEFSPQHVVDLTIQPVAAFHTPLHRRHGGLAAISLNLEHELVPVAAAKTGDTRPRSGWRRQSMR